jgi:hypothetical protein
MALLALLLNSYRRYRRWMLQLYGLTEADASYRNVATGNAWEEFCEQLKGAGAAILAPGAPQDALTQAEGYRYLSRLVRGGLENFVEASDPLAPRLVCVANGLRDAPVKLGSDSPDNLYENAPLDGTRTYRVYGSRGTVAYLGIGVQAGSYGAPGGLATVSYAETDEFAPVQPAAAEAERYRAEGGYLEFFIGPERPAGATNWLRSATEPADGQVIVRHTFLDRAAETPARLVIELVDAVTLQPVGVVTRGHAGPPDLTPARIESGLQKTALLVAGAPLMFNRWISGFMRHANTLPLFDVSRSNSAGGDPNIRYYHSYWRVERGEALVIDSAVPECDNWNFQLDNHWMESLDYRHRQVCVNKRTAKYAADGSVRVVVCHERPPQLDQPGLRRPVVWCDPCAHVCGVMTWRWIRPKVPDELLPQPKCVLTTFDAFCASLSG